MRITLLIFLLICFQSGFGQQPQKVTEKKNDSTIFGMLDDVVVFASRINEKFVQSPITIRKADSKFFQSAPAASFFDAIENLQGVQMITPSLGFKVVNARGFANTTNVRFAQLVDGMDVQSPHIGGPIGNAIGPTDLDIDNVELIPGVASALYGMNTINGLANFSTKNPFKTPGLSLQQKTGVNHIGDNETAARLYSETSLRFAKIVSSKFAFKVNANVMKGYDWMANDRTDINATANNSAGLFGDSNPAKDAVNGYGNESSNRRTLSLAGKSYVVARTGYQEPDVVDYSVQNFKGDVGLYFKPTAGSTLTYLFKMALLNNVYQRSNRFRLQDYFVQQHGLQYQSNSIVAKVYLNNESTGKSYNLRSMAENLERASKTDNTWFADYANAFNSSNQTGSSLADAHQQARVIADANRFQPGSASFNNTLQKLQNINNWDSGAALRVKASFIQAEVQVNVTEAYLLNFKKHTGIDVLVGADHRTYLIQPDGNYFINPEKGKEFKNIVYGKTGGFVSLSKRFFATRLKLGAILRTDKNDYFKQTWNPRFTAVYAVNKYHFLRASYQSGFRFPSIFEAYSNINSGGVKRVGGLPVMSKGVVENAWLQSSIATFQSAVLNDLNRNGFSSAAAIVKNAGLLKKNPYTYIQPEQIKSIETGYKGIYNGGKISIDVDVYFNTYRNFIAQANMNVPNTQQADSIPFALYNRTRQSPYRVWTNSQTKVVNYGFSAGVKYQLFKTYMLLANTSFARLHKSASEDGLEDGFNTPKWISNISLTNDRLYKTFGAALSYKWQSAYYWRSFLVNGETPAYATLDAQVSWQVTKLQTKIKIGATNLLNNYYASFLGGPQIGAFYYSTLTFDLHK